MADVLGDGAYERHKSGVGSSINYGGSQPEEECVGVSDVNGGKDLVSEVP